MGDGVEGAARPESAGMVERAAIAEGAAPAEDAGMVDGGGAVSGGSTIRDGSAGTTDEFWLEIVEAGTCAGCGLAGASAARSELGVRLASECDRFADLLRSTPVVALRRRPDGQVWSALEYAVHVTDTLTVFTDRIRRMLEESDPDLGWWDHEAAIADGSANRADPLRVASDLAAATAGLIASIEVIGAPADAGADDGWGRRGIRRGTEVFTVESKVRFALHELRHHRVDAANGLAMLDS